MCTTEFAASAFGLAPRNCPAVPPHLPSMNIQKNMAQARTMGTGQIYAFYSAVRGKGPMDYKQAKTLNTDVPNGMPLEAASMFEDFGNFNYGAVGGSQGYNLNFLLRAAGYAGQRAVGKSMTSAAHTAMGPAPYGDDPADQIQIINGYNYAKLGCP
jgi:hypothetical protein